MILLVAGFGYRTQINGWIFLVVGMVDVYWPFQWVKAAIVNPVESLKRE